MSQMCPAFVLAATLKAFIAKKVPRIATKEI
jgi:hypothetical protein